MRLTLATALALLATVLCAGEVVLAPVPVALDKGGNVRFGPSTTARQVVTLKAGTQLEVFGPSRTAPDWYVIRFPKEGRVWIHGRNLKALDGGVRYQVTADKTRARADSTFGAEIVAELDAGEVVEDKGLVVGDWRSVYIPDAVAYVHRSLLNLPPDLEKTIQERQDRVLRARQIWDAALSTYAQHVELVKASPKAAVGLDWAGLAAQLDIVISDHDSAATRIAARRVREAIAAVVKPASELAPEIGQAPPRPIADPAPATAPAPTTATPTTTTAGPVPPPALPQLPPPPPPSRWQGEGLLLQDDAYAAKVGTRDVLIDGNGEIVAFLKQKDGVDLKLSELNGREVGARGEVLMIAPEQSGLPKPVKLIVATDVAPLR